MNKKEAWKQLAEFVVAQDDECEFPPQRYLCHVLSPEGQRESNVALQFSEQLKAEMLQEVKEHIECDEDLFEIFSISRVGNPLSWYCDSQWFNRCGNFARSLLCLFFAEMEEGNDTNTMT